MGKFNGLFECEPNCKYCYVNNEPAIERFWSKIDKTATCWIYKGSLNAYGYGWFSYLGKPVLAHRFSKSLQEKLVIGKEIDHICRNRACVNPNHLEQVTHKTNIYRAPIHVIHGHFNRERLKKF